LLSDIEIIRNTRLEELKKIHTPTSKDCCKALQCIPAQNLWTMKFHESFPEMNTEQILKIIRYIEKRLFQKNCYRNPKSVVSVAVLIYCKYNSIPRHLRDLSKIFETDYNSMAKLFRTLNLSHWDVELILK
jgi:transcription initiation factor TFIIIB Brf1 subunit/transcription initiation factor TFIIB